MKKSLILLTLFCFFLFGCENIGSTINKNKKTNELEKTKTSTLKIDELKIEPNTPQFWIDLFTFQNVTILLKNNLTIKRGDTYKCVNGEWHVMYQGTDAFEDHDGRYIFDIYLANFSIFTYDAENSCYVAHDARLDNSGYLSEIVIEVFDNKITHIEHTASLNSSVIISTLDFSNYGETSLTN